MLLHVLVVFYNTQDGFIIHLDNTDLSKTSHSGYVPMYNVLEINK